MKLILTGLAACLVVRFFRQSPTPRYDHVDRMMAPYRTSL